MAFLTVFGKIIEYKDAEEARKILREHAVNYIAGLNFESSSDNEFEPKFGYECEVHKIKTKVDENGLKTIQIDLSGEFDIQNHHNFEENSDYIYQVEFGKWMVEGTFFK